MEAAKRVEGKFKPVLSLLSLILLIEVGYIFNFEAEEDSLVTLPKTDCKRAASALLAESSSGLRRDTAEGLVVDNS